MKISIILAHPDSGSFNHSIARRTANSLRQNGHHVFWHDLYEEKFDPLLLTEEIPRDAALPELVSRHCHEIRKANGLFIVHPNWWGQPPAILKGWVDRVLRPGVAYEFLEGDSGDGVPHGLLKAEAAIVFNTSNTETSRELEVFQDPLETIWKNCIFGLCGVERFHRRVFNIVVTSTPQQREKWLNEVQAIVDHHFPTAPGAGL